MFADDVSYFQHRAEVEFHRAQEASAPEAIIVHWQLAEAYLQRLSKPDGVMTDATTASRDGW